MIQAVTITNFQSHKNTHLDFSSGINCITGESDNGKSGILRALYWLIENKPRGDSFISFWNRDEKGKQIKETEVAIVTDVSNIARRKALDLNAYMLGGNVYEAVGQDVPPAVHSFLNIGAVNISKQLDAPFLISSSAGEIARFFNEIIKLEEIDTCLAAADSYKREVNAALKAAELQEIEAGKALEKYSFLENAVLQAVKCANIEERLADIDKHCQGLNGLIIQGVSAGENLQKYSFLSAAEGLIKKIEKNKADLGVVENNIRQYKTFLENYHTTQESLKSIPDIVQAGKKISIIEGIVDQLQITTKKTKEVENCYYLLKGTKADTETAKGQLHLLEKRLPTVCPLCGKKL